MMLTKKVMRIIVIMLLDCLIAGAAVDKRLSTVSEVWGRAVKVRPDQAFYGHRYFIYYVAGEKQFAYPIEITNKKQEKIIDQLQNKLAKVSGSVRSTRIVSDGTPMDMVYFVPSTITPLSLDALDVQNQTSHKAQYPGMISVLSPFKASEGGIRLSDPAAEVSVYTAAGILLGNILKGYLTRK